MGRDRRPEPVPPGGPERSLKREGFRLRSLELLRWRWTSAAEGRRTLGRLRGSFAGESGRRFDEAFARLAADVRADGGQLLALLWPMTPALGAGDYPLGELHRRIARQAHALDVELIDLLPAVEGWPRERSWAHPTDPHPSPELHAAAAAALAARIEQLEAR